MSFWEKIYFPLKNATAWCCIIMICSVYRSSAQTDLTVDFALLNAFKQGKAYNNCAAIALIKAALGTYGVEAVVKTEKVDSGFVFRLRNHEVVFLTQEELTCCISRSGFVQKNFDSVSIAIKRAADTCFAVMCKKQQYKDQITLDVAVKKINNGYKTSEIAFLLGVQFKRIQSTSSKKLAAYKHVVVYNFYHAAYSTNGVYDYTDNSLGYTSVKNFKWNHTDSSGEYYSYLCDIREAFSIIDY